MTEHAQNYGLVLDIGNMVKVLSSGDARFTLNIPAFELKRGNFYGLVGRSGSGKSTMLDLLAMVARPTRVGHHTLYVPGQDGGFEPIELSGSVGVDSHVMEPKSDARRDQITVTNDALVSAIRRDYLGYVLQTGGLFSYLSVLENLELPFRMSGTPFNPEEVLHLAERFELAGQLKKKPPDLSGGQRQRVSILRALVTDPVLLLADEPTAAVDEQLAEVIVKEMHAMATERGSTVVMVSHDIELVGSFADQLVPLVPQTHDRGQVETICELRQ